MEFIQCRLCGRHFQRITHLHLRYEHDGMTVRQYQEMFPEAPTMTDESYGRALEACAEAVRMREILWSDPEYSREWGKAISRGQEMMSPEAHERWCEGIASSHLGKSYPRSEETREKQGRSLKAWWASLSPEVKHERMKPLREYLSQVGPNQAEAQLWKFLEQAFPGLFIPDWVENVCIGGKYPDFRSTNGYNIIIEIFGNYWHGPEFSGLSEEELIALYQKEGYNCIVVWADNAEDIISEWPKLAGKIREVL